MDNWISVDERLPENCNDVLSLNITKQRVVFYTKGYEIEFEDFDDTCDYDEIEERNGTHYLKQGWYELEDTPGGQYDYTYVVRKVKFWQPLPEPPKTHSQEEINAWDSVN